jgi:alcohol dehydrogenase class IV
MEANLSALNKREPENLAIKRYRDVARILSGDDQAGPEYGAAWVQSLCETLKIQPLAAFGVDRADFQAIIEQSARSSSMRGNPIQLTPAEMEEILDQAVD